MKVILTEDGSHTLYSEQFDEAYHSRRGALTESQYIFIQSGLSTIDSSEISVFEVGFGTGLNAFLSWIYAEEHKVHINYTAIELYPVPDSLLPEINYADLFPGHKSKFDALHHASWEDNVQLSGNFRLHKINQSTADFVLPKTSQHVIYFDAFSPEKQPELWSADIFQRMYAILFPGGILVTYCSKGYVRRNMKQAGFMVKKLPGPPGKHEIVRATKPLNPPMGKLPT